MYIIDKNKDFYDHHSYIYGVDKKVMFDRRGSKVISDKDIANLLFLRSYTLSRTHHIVVEIGLYQYLLEIHNVVFEDKMYEEFKSFSIKLKEKFDKRVSVFGIPISIHCADMPFKFNWISGKYKRSSYENYTFDDMLKGVQKEHGIKLPIIKNTSLTKVLNSDTIWKEIQNYISSLNNDKDVMLDMTDKQKADIHGFDKYSFRNPIK